MADKKTQSPKLSEHTKDLLLLFSVPIAISIIAIVLVYVPRMLANPGYDFLYSYCEGYDCRSTFSPDANGKLTRHTSTEEYSSYREKEELIGYYDTSTGATRIITFEEAQNYYLYNSSKSPDGFELERETGDIGFLFWGSYDESWVLKNGIKRKPVNLNGSERYYSDGINFLGWVNE